MDVFFPPYTRLIYFESSEQLWDFVLFCRLIHSLKPSYQVSVRQVRCLPTASFRFHLTMDTFAFGCSLPTVRATWGLAPVRIRSCWANKEESDIGLKPSRTLLMLQNSFLFQRNLISRLSLLGVNQISIDLSSGDILMRQHLRYCVNVCA